MSGRPFEHQMFLLDTNFQLSDDEKIIAMKNFEMASSIKDDLECTERAKGVSSKRKPEKRGSGCTKEKRRIQDDSDQVRKRVLSKKRKVNSFGEESRQCSATGVLIEAIPVKPVAAGVSSKKMPVANKHIPLHTDASKSENVISVETELAKFIVGSAVDKTSNSVDEGYGRHNGTNNSRWIPSEVWRQQGMEVENIILTKEMTLRKDDATITLKDGESVMIIKFNNRKYVQLCNGELISIKKDT
ncbi:hypothetical protein Bhyg_03022, partial [Pseudolycoriella hygida]